MIWSKAFVMERERYDGADIAHLLNICAARLDWGRLLHRFEPHWRVLLSHLILFGFIYPAERTSVPTWVMGRLIERLRHETHARPRAGSSCCAVRDPWQELQCVREEVQLRSVFPRPSGLARGCRAIALSRLALPRG